MNLFLHIAKVVAVAAGALTVGICGPKFGFDLLRKVTGTDHKCERCAKRDAQRDETDTRT